jgi:alginate O-acetyltransferase complex protein AlgI
MLFNSYFFVLCFLPLVLWLWWQRSIGLQSRLALLVVASYLFYGWWDYRFVSLLVVSTLVDYQAGRRLHASQNQATRRFWLGVSLVTNLGLLAFFKYCGFFATSLNAVGDLLQFGGRLSVPEILLPIGISFYTFQTMSYSIDIYRGKAEPAQSLLHFAAYVAMFPQLIAGPIVRYAQIEDQLREIRQHPYWPMLARGICFFVAGMCQKVLLADPIAAQVDPLLAQYEQLQIGAAWFCTLGYTCQLYFDFAGYSNMAVGLGYMLGFSFPQNFDSPYKSDNIATFWRRWHMTLSFWLRDYLFIPLGGSQHGPRRTLRNLFIVMALGGLWHGAGWTFVLWGIYHGMLLIIHFVNRRQGWVQLPRMGSVALTFVAVMVGWVIFRSTDINMCCGWLGAMLGLRIDLEQLLVADHWSIGWVGWEANVLTAVGGIKSVAILGALVAIIFALPNLWQIRFRPTVWSAAVLSVAFAVCVLRFHQESPFLYFQF